MRKIYDSVGIEALNGNYLLKHHKSLYKFLGKQKIKLDHIAEEWGILEEHTKEKQRRYCEAAGKNIRTNEWFDTKVKEFIAEHGCIPAMNYLTNNGEGSFINYMYQIGLNWQQLHEKYDIPMDCKLLARNNFYMDSYAEVCLVNFLWCRGIEIKKGEYYTNDYTKNTGRKGIYDLHFKGSIGIYKDTWISVEIWGGTKGHNEKEYNEKRKEKEDSHKDDNCFLGIEYSDCYKENRLIKI